MAVANDNHLITLRCFVREYLHRVLQVRDRYVDRDRLSRFGCGRVIRIPINRD